MVLDVPEDLDVLTDDEYQIAHDAVMGCLVRLVEALEIEGSMQAVQLLECIEKREQLNCIVDPNELEQFWLEETTKETSHLALKYLKTPCKVVREKFRGKEFMRILN